jgi:predicted nucleic acid-binding protein
LIVYLDTSVILRILFGQRNAYAGWGEWRVAYTSELTYVEGLRTIDRFRLQNRIDDSEVAEKITEFKKILDCLGLITVKRTVLLRAAEPRSTLINTLDALHLASAYLWRERHRKEMIFLTHDSQLGIAAKAIGFTVEGVAS